MEEKNRDTLLRAISELPVHRPPSANWDGIRAEMDFYERESALRRALRRLPEYAPPPKVWGQIEGALHKPIIRLPRLSTLSRAAAIILLAGIPAVLWYSGAKHESERVQYAYAVEKASVPFIPVAVPEDEAAIEEVGEIFSRQHAVFQFPEGARLIGELKELNEAGEELRTVLENYGFDETLSLELTKVELQRNQVIQKITSLL